MRAPSLLADAMERAEVSRVIVAFALLQVGLFAVGLGGWRCPIRAVTGVPCPGCGLTHSLAALAGGHWSEAVADHPLGPVVAVVGALLLAGAVLPRANAGRLASRVRGLERALWLDVLLVIAAFAAWGWRLWRESA